MRAGSMFSGIGGFDLGLERAGIEVAWQAEIDPYCSKVLAHHWPGVINYGDVRNIGMGRAQCNVAGKPLDTEARIPKPERGAADVDLIVGGFPCQDVSVAGQRKGLAGERSGLWFEFQRVLSELRPRWAIIENVAGLLSSNQGRDFATILDGLGECGFGGIGWAVLDSQHFGVAQRRRRVFIVGGPTARSVEQILSICESCGGNSAAGRETRERASLAAPLGSNEAGGTRLDLDHDTYIPDLAYAVKTTDAKRSGSPERGDMTLVSIQDVRSGASKNQNGIGVSTGEIAYTLDTVSQPAVAFTERSRKEGRTLEASEELAYALTNPGAGGRSDSRQILYGGVRRLTPTEFERLQGFPDGWTFGPDSSRYRALGNAVTVPVIEWLGLQLMALEGD